MRQRECDKCKQLTSMKELGRKVRGDYLCDKCKKLRRKEHREETIEDSGIKEELNELEREIKNESQRKYYDKKKEGKVPIPKGSKIITKKKSASCYLSFYERQALFRNLLSRGISSDEAKTRIQNLADSQKELRKQLKENNVEESEIRIKQNKLLEELWRS